MAQKVVLSDEQKQHILRGVIEHAEKVKEYNTPELNGTSEQTYTPRETPKKESEQERISDTSAHAEAEREKARKESHVTNNILFEQWKAGFDKRREEKNAEERDKLQKQLKELNQNAAYSSTTAASDEYEQERKSLLEQLHALDEAEGREARTYDGRERAGAFFGSWGKGTGASYTNAAANIVDLGNEVGASAKAAERELADLEAQLARAQTAYDEAVQQYGEAGATAEKNLLADAQQKLDAKKTLYASTADRDRAAYEKTKATAGNMYDVADKLLTQSEEDMARAKVGTSALGSFALDAAKTGLDIGLDTAVSALGVPGLANMAARVYGTEAQQARLQGDDARTAAAKGLKSALIEVATEKIAGPFEKAYGKTALSSSINKAVDKLNASGLLKWAADTAGEGFEEGMSDVLNTVADHIMGWDSGENTVWGDIAADKDEILYDMLLGAFVGAFGSAGNIVGNRATTAPAEQAAPVQQNTAQPQTENSAVNVIEALLAQGKISNSQAGKVVESPTLADAFYEVTGIALEGTKAQKRATIKAAAQAEAQTSPVADVQPTGDISTPPMAQNVKQGDSDALNSAVNYNSRETQAEAPSQAQKNTVPKQEAENTIMQESDLPDYMATGVRQHVRNAKDAQLKNGGSPILTTIEQIKGFIRSSLRGETIGTIKGYGKVGSRMAQDISDSSDGKTDVRGYYLELDGNRIRHMKDHVDTDSDGRNIPLTSAQAEQLTEYIDNYDEVLDVLTRKDGSTKVYLSKDTGDGHVVIVELVSKGRQSLQPVTAWQNTYEAFENIWGKKKEADSASQDRQTPISRGYQPTSDSGEQANPTSLAPVDDTGAISPPITNTQQGVNAEDVSSDISIPTDTQNVKQNFAGNGRAPFKATYNKEPQTARKKKLSRFWENTLQRTETAAGVADDVKQPLFYLPKTEKQSLAEAASRLSGNKQQTVEKLVSAEAWSGTQVDTAAAVATDLYKEARETGNYEAYTAWRKVMENHVAEGGRGIQALAKYSRETGENALNTIANMIEKSNLTPEQRQTLINKVGWYAARFDEINEITKENNGILSDDNKAELISLIEDMAHERGTWTFVKKLYSDLLKKQDGDYLGKYAYKQILAMGGDMLSKATFAEKVKAYQTLAQLTSLATFKRNIGGNVSFGIVDTLSQDGFAVAIDRLMSKATGKRTVAIDKGWFSREARAGAIDAMQKSILDVAGDVAGNQNRFDMTAGRAFKMDGNAFERFMSRWQQLLGYSLTTTDRFSRGAIESEQKRGLRALEDSGLTEDEINELATNMADHRLFQNKGIAYAGSKWAHDFANLAGFGGKVDPKDFGKGRQGGFGAGDLGNPYPGVPANLGVKALEYSPANIVKGGIELIKVISDAKAGKVNAVKQQQAVMDISRGLAGVPAIALVSALVKAGLIKNWDDEEDPDIRAQNAAEGKTGVQINLTGALRYLTGKTNTITWEPTDETESIGWLEPINAFFAIGSLMANEDENADIWDYAGDWVEGSIQAFLEIPVMSNIADIEDTLRYSNADNWGAKIGEAATKSVGNVAAGFIPQPIRALAKTTDKYYRDTSGDTPFEQSWNQMKNAIPGLRQTLDVKLDNFGNPKVYSGSPATRAFNAFSNPGDRKTITQSEASKVIESLYKQTGDAEIYPDRKGVNRIKVNGESFELSAKEKREYKRVSGNTSEELIESLINNSLYKKAEPDIQTQLIKNINSYAESKATADWADSRGLYLSNEYTELEREGISDVTNYLIAEQALSTAKNAPTDTSYSYLDEIIDYWSKLSQPTQEKLRDSQLNVDALRYADALGIDSKDWYSTKKAIAKSAKTMGKTDVATAISVYNNTKGKSDTEILNAIRSQLVPDEGGKQNATVRRIEAYNKIAGENADLQSWLNLLAELHDADVNSSVSKEDAYKAWSNMGLDDNETYAGITRNDFYNIVKSNNSYANNEKYATQIDEAYARIDPAQEKEKEALSGTVNGLQTIWQILGI